MNSLRRRLFLLLLAATGAVWLCAVGWIYLGSRAELEHVLDARLQEAARMVHSLVAGGNITGQADPLPLPGNGYERQLSCQIWSLDGELVARSSGAPDASLAQDTEGFADRRMGDELWRVYTIVDPVKGVRVAVGDRIGLRDRLVRGLVGGLVTPALLIAPLLGLLIWLSLGRGLRPLNAVAGEIAARDGEDMRPIAPGDAPAEVRPLISAINGLLGKVEVARRHEREITAFAAHELRTPLAGLKTQAQVALATTDAAGRDRALGQIIVSVDRTARLVSQLLALARLEAMPDARSEARVNAGAALREAISAAGPSAGHVVDVDPALDALEVPGDPECLHLVLRNLHENAVRHTPAPGRIRWSALRDGTGLAVEDDGPGVAAEELEQITRRFYRGRGGGGAGLGLTIARLAADRLGARLSIANREETRGLRSVLVW